MALETESEQAARRVESKLNEEAQAIAHFGLWEWVVTEPYAYWSDELYRIYGVTRETYVPSYENYLTKIHPDDKERVIKATESALKELKRYVHDERIYRPDGSVRHLRTWAYPVLDTDGKLIKLMGVCQDITDHKQIELDLEKSNSLLMATIEATADGILVLDLEGKLLIHNKKFSQLWGFTEEDLQGDIKRKDMIDKILDQLKEPEEFLKRADEVNKVENEESFDVLEFKDGRVYERVTKGQKIQGKTVGKVLSFRDVTARVRAERAALAASHAKTQFLANTSHELRTPLGAIIGFTELILSSNSPKEENTDSLNRIRNNAVHLLEIVDEILDISRIEYGRIDLSIKKTSVSDIISEVSDMFVESVATKKIFLKFQIDGDIPEFIQTDPIKLRQILINIVGNAVKFTQKGGVTVTVKQIFDLRHQSQLAFTVEDTGIGMTPAQEQRLFEPFTQVDESLSRKYGGTGLGLALSRNMAILLGGTVRLVSSQLHMGSVFEAVVRTGQLDQVARISSFRPKSNVAKEEQVTSVAHELSDKKILLVDDSQDNQVFISKMLGLIGLKNIELASDGNEAVDKALHHDYDMVIMDIQMPELDGYQAVTKLREAGYQVPVIALTAHAMKEEKNHSLEVGFNEHLTKPISRQQLESIVHQFLLH